MSHSGNRRDDWRTIGPSRPDRPTKQNAGTGRRVALAAVILALLVGLVISFPLFLNNPREPICFAVPVVEYHKARDSRWPPNPWAESDAHGFRDQFQGESAQAFQHQQKAALLRELANVISRADMERSPLVVYITALGTVVNDIPYILPADARPHDPPSWLTLEEVLDPIRRGTTPRLVVLDVRPVRSPRAALPTGDVNELLDKKLAAWDAANDLPLLVLIANTPATGPLNLPTVKHTAFGYALERGVLGDADGWLPADQPNQEVTARELAEYARECTFAATNGAQRPQLYGQGSDFRLRTLPPDRHVPIEPERLKYPQWLADAWTDIDRARATGLPGRAPRAMRQQTDAAVDAELGWFAGANESSLKDRFAGTFAAFRTELAGDALAPPKLPVASIARARREMPDFVTHVRAAEVALQPVFTLLKSDTFANTNKSEPTKAVAMLEAKLGEVKVPETVPFVAVAAVLWASADDTPTTSHIRTLLSIVDKLAVKDQSPVAELVALELITLIPGNREPKDIADVISAWLDATTAAESALLFDGRGLPLLRDRLERAEKVYREEALVMVDLNTTRDRFVRVAKNLREAQTEYVIARGDAEEVSDAWQRSDTVSAALIDLADRYPNELTLPTTGRACSLSLLTDAYSTVVGQLHADAVDFAQLKRDSATLQTRLMDVMAPVKLPATDKRIPESTLDWPGWTSAQRRMVIERLQDAGGEVLANWPTATSGRALPAPTQSGPSVFAGSARALFNRTDLIRLWDLQRAKEIRGQLEELDQTSADRFSRLASKVSAEFRDEPLRRFNKDVADRPTIGWAVSPDDVSALPADDPTLSNPEVVAIRRAEATLGEWVKEQRFRWLSKQLERLADSRGSRGDRFMAVARRYKAVADLFP